MIEKLNELEQILDKEIKTYKEIDECIIDKKNILMKNDAESLLKVDQKLLSYSQKMTDLEKERINFYSTMTPRQSSLSAIIESAMNLDRNKANKIQEKRNKIVSLAKNIEKNENTNKELVKHSLKMIESTVSMIAKALNPKMDSYGNTGKAYGRAITPGLSSIVKEA